jgi:Flp pilus assembly pilin Flp
MRRQSRSGQALSEYALAIALIASISLVGLALVSGGVVNIFSTISSSIHAVPGQGSPTPTPTPAPTPALIPSMTSDTAPSGTASALATARGYDAYLAFVDGSGAQYWPGQGDYLPNWLEYAFVSPVSVGSYCLEPYAPGGDTSYEPTAWLFQGSNDGSTWTTVDSQSGVSWAGTSSCASFALSSPATYSQWRWYFTQTTSNRYDTTTVLVGYAQIYAATAP